MVKKIKASYTPSTNLSITLWVLRKFLTSNKSEVIMNTTKCDVLILGGGIVGTSLAYTLQKEGRKATVLDKGPIGFGCSYGNAGWITPCFAMPLPQPGMFWKSIGWLLDPESPLYIKPEPSALLFQWLLRFTKYMTYKKMNSSIEVLTEISKESLKIYTELSKTHSYGFQKKGLLMVSRTQVGLKDGIAELELMAKRGIEGHQLTGDEICEMEPAFKKGLLGGVYFPNEAHAEPLSAVEILEEEAKNSGADFRPFTEVYDFDIQNGQITKVYTTKGNFEANTVVLAMGTWSHQLASKFKLNTPIMGGKGYSLIVHNFKTPPTHPMMLIEKKIAVTPRKNSVRVAGTLELVKNDDSLSPKRIQAIIKGTQEFLDLPPSLDISEIWRGLRPCTPDGVPMIGYSKKVKNLFYCTGHQMLGLQSAPGSARLATELILGKTPYVRPEPFDPNRF